MKILQMVTANDGWYVEVIDQRRWEVKKVAVFALIDYEDGHSPLLMPMCAGDEALVIPYNPRITSNRSRLIWRDNL